MAQLYSTGPVGIWVGTGASGAAVFLGHGEQAPRINTRTLWKPQNCDLTGDVPIDKAMTGEMATVSVTLIRYNEPVLAIIQDRAGLIGRGVMFPGDIGTLMMTEGLNYQLWLQFPYSVKAAYTATMPAGYRFPGSFMESPDDLQVGTTTAKKISITFTCLPVLDMTVSNAFGTGSLTLYDHDMTALTAVN